MCTEKRSDITSLINGLRDTATASGHVGDSAVGHAMNLMDISGFKPLKPGTWRDSLSFLVRSSLPNKPVSSVSNVFSRISSGIKALGKRT